MECKTLYAFKCKPCNPTIFNPDFKTKCKNCANFPITPLGAKVEKAPKNDE